ncbi:reticulophagy regulator 3 isoform X3 [Malaclemys terrapin pileata]|uniref:reticulophagy regulator 3 isoform X3 n=3 Tax=Malaclemys terrapin pileata TaxID=2991368 RepID=UPI0023A7BDBA|nr:reticulophagy regulator 3 isoform X3 [Malaclemys terrapin pileata]
MEAAAGGSRTGGPGERERRVRALSAALRARLGPYEPLLSALQAALVWERPGRSALGWAGAHGAFCFLALTSLRLVFLVAFGLIIIVCLDQWKNKIWPEIKVARSDELDNESWGYVHPQLLSVPELSHHLADGWVTGVTFLRNLFVFKRQNPGKFCLVVCGVFTFLAVLGRYIPGLLLSYLMLLFILLWPLAVYHRLGQRMYMKLEPALQRLDFSVRGYMMSKQRVKQLHQRAPNQEPADAGTDSEEELAAFCPKLDDSVVAKELTISDSEHSDAEVSYTENGTFNLSRGQTPLTEGSEDLDGHSDPEESFARDLPDFPSINPEVTGIDDEDDTSIGIPSLAYRSQGMDELRHPYDQEEAVPALLLGALPSAHNLTNNLAGFVTRGMIQLALSGASEPGPVYSDNPQRGTKTYLRTSSSDLDTDAEGDDFELLDQSELDPAGSRGQLFEENGFSVCQTVQLLHE